MREAAHNGHNRTVRPARCNSEQRRSLNRNNKDNNGSTPTASSPVYTAPFTVTSNATVQFFSVDNAGNVEAVKTQQVQILALVSIAVTPASATIAQGTTQQFTATGTYNDGTTQDLTSSANWASSNTPSSTVSATGLATA